MLRRVLKYIRDNELLQPSDRVLVCVSGGADSVALLDVLLRGGYECVAAHCNFHLRGEESNRDEQYVRRLCAERNVPLEVREFDTLAESERIGRSVEMTARLLRYEWFEKTAKQHDCQAIAVAHHQNDQAETLLMNLRRGAGIRGLCGMRPKSTNPCGEMAVIRPLLCTTHDYIVHYLRDIRHIDWVEDSTNSDTHIRRNSIREELSRYPKAEIEHIAQTARIMQGYVDWMEGKETLAAREVQKYEKDRQ
ncbi:MAG: tRNA lysidine(34) synthetase TilS [Paludibacteraceae bacterium]|nr:tRNA lysidine(34) synthetase TilS [Paludibacteraceae bacterium]